MNLIVLRHGEVPSNLKKVYAGKSPEGLTERGACQAKEVEEKIRSYKVHALYSSPIQRALETAEIIGKKIGLEPVIEKAFREMELGPWEGMSETEIAITYPEEWKIWQSRPTDLKLHGRETLHELLERVLIGVQNIHSDAANIVVITHVAIIRVLLLWHAKKSLNLYKTIHIPNAEIFKIRIDTYPCL